jgi:hypothetical protein
MDKTLAMVFTRLAMNRYSRDQVGRDKHAKDVDQLRKAFAKLLQKKATDAPLPR